MKCAGLEKPKVAYKVYGDKENTLVIDACLCSCSAEWWHIAEKLSDSYKVIVFDRAGTGRSAASLQPRTPRNITNELNTLLAELGIRSKITLLGHSQGGYYSIQYALMFPERIKGLILLDPATPFDDEFRELLTEEEYKSSGVEKTGGYRLGRLLASLRLGFLFKPLLLKSPPFCYHSFDKEAQQYMLQSLMRRSTYQTALDEYKYTHLDGTTSDVKKAIESGALGSIPVRLVTHSSDIYVQELMKYASLGRDTACKIETIWQSIMKGCLALSADSEHITAPNSGHYIHLTDYELVKATLLDLL